MSLNLESACSYKHNPGDSCISAATADKILASPITKLNPKILKSLDGTVDELNILLDEKVIELLGEKTILAELKNFKPIGPTDHSLFSNFHENTLLQHFAAFEPSFYPIDVQLMDFTEPHYKFNRKLLDFLSCNVDKIISGEIKTAGCILNTLRSDGSLSRVGHWVAMFMDFRTNPTIEYFNSSGKSAPKEVFVWMEEFCVKFTEATGKSCTAVNVSNVVHQKSDTECGAYSIYYVSARMLGFPYKKFREKPIPDSVVNKFRSYAFNSLSKVKNIKFLDRHHLA
jgi:Ulp1 protease family, C-terminal catalytic domain